jgi:hypothetical protein
VRGYGAEGGGERGCSRTDPVAAEGETVAVSVTLVPAVVEVVEASRLVVVEVSAVLTVMLTALDVLVV